MYSSSESISKFWNVIVTIISTIQMIFVGYMWMTYRNCTLQPLPGYKAEGMWWEKDGQMISGAGLLLTIFLFYMTLSTYISTLSKRPDYMIVSFVTNTLLSLFGMIMFIFLGVLRMPAFDVVCVEGDGKDFLHDVLIAISIFIVYWTFILNQMHIFFEEREKLLHEEKKRKMPALSAVIVMEKVAVVHQKAMKPCPNVIEDV